jgi:hypothetical protein
VRVGGFEYQLDEEGLHLRVGVDAELYHVPKETLACQALIVRKGGLSPFE